MALTPPCTRPFRCRQSPLRPPLRLSMRSLARAGSPGASVHGSMQPRPSGLPLVRCSQVFAASFHSTALRTAVCRSFESTVVIQLGPQLRCSDGHSRRHQDLSCVWCGLGLHRICHCQHSQSAEATENPSEWTYCAATLSVLAKRRLMRRYSSTMPVINTNVTEITVV